MQVSWDTYLERVGPQGLRLIVATLCDDGAFAALTRTTPEDLSPGERANFIADFLAEDPSRAGELFDALDARVAALSAPDEADWDEARIREELAALLRSPDPLGARHLHRLARSSRPALPATEIRAAAEVLAPLLLGEDPGSRPKYVAKVASDRAGLRELEQDRRELEARVRQLETQLQRAVDRVATLEERLARQIKDLHDAHRSEKDVREERARLEKDVARLEKRVAELNERRAQEGTGQVSTALRRLTTEQRRANALLDKLRHVDADRRETSRDLLRRVAGLGDLLEKLTTQHEAGAVAAAAAQEAILRQLAAPPTAASAGDGEAAGETRHRRRPRAEGLPRVGLFVDVQNMFYAAREKGARLDFEALLAATTEGRQLVRAVAYVVETREIDQRAFIHLLEMKAWEVKRKPLRIRPDRTMKGNWDLEMALDALHTADTVDIIVLVTGDGDFVPLVRQLKLAGRRVEVYGFPRSSAPDLREAADRFVSITRRLLRPIDHEKRARAAALKTRQDAEAEATAAAQAAIEVEPDVEGEPDAEGDEAPVPSRSQPAGARGEAPAASEVRSAAPADEGR